MNWDYHFISRNLQRVIPYGLVTIRWFIILFLRKIYGKKLKIK